MSYLLKVSEEEVKQKQAYLNAAGNAECVEFVRQTTDAPATTRWRPGAKIAGAPFGSIKRGTAIATFDGKDRYPSDAGGRHAAIYLAHSDTGIVVLDQWNAKGKVSRRTIRFDPKSRSRSNDGNTYYVIE